LIPDDFHSEDPGRSGPYCRQLRARIVRKSEGTGISLAFVLPQVERSNQER
jgi:hypothetical protein